MPPKPLAKRDDGGAKGVLPVTAATRAAASKGPAPRLKLEIRRLPPGLTLTEFEEILGDEWKPGNGRVDWREYRQGKVKQSAAKVPEQSRCYMHLLSEPILKELEVRFLEASFHDKAGTYRLPDLKHLPPTIGYAPNQRVPTTTKVRTDNRQGTIDQDPEFMLFLQAETQPIFKPAALDTLGVEAEKAEKEQIKSTPLIEALREKKANKAKAAEAKVEKKDGKGHQRTGSKDNAVAEKGGKDGKATQQQKAQQQKIEQVSKEAVKALNKQVANKQQQAQQPDAAKASSTASAASATPPRAPRQRGNAEGIKRMLQKDLGIKPKPQPAAQNTSQPAAPNLTAASPATPSAIKREAARPSTPASTTIPTGPAKQQATPKQPAAPTPVVSSTKAYLKHANPSQGMTEILIQQALSQYGEVNNVTIDPRKGTAIAIFKENDGLKKALEAKKVPVANGSVEVLEWKDRAVNVGGRGGFHGRRGGGARGGRGGAQVPIAAAAAAAPTVPKGGGGEGAGG
ncbi:uncharacterized protein MYCFIDRAFT_190784 [Pseudocercospora fijiensis CIRAD86]|uniref:UPF3 domain-containing protein n=1 Tax=Pseudocercospora fijiensis (strain CIRAD86) TaxID=383855 RepID=M3AN25_PSEFD|nr:uncharacterized protein MYCFIDRAFT_190784 [Pseudocercospora fijiensis CIRAD86]EME78533.1 hypothetical protein MYCFIDRAFT_190784 [Pseudocercospora fijiensis CIRAD86]